MSIKEPRTRKRYSTAFKRKVVREIETGELTMAQARRLYGIGGSMTIPAWLEAFGKGRTKRIFVHTSDEDDPMTKLEAENKRLRKEKDALESALAQAHLKTPALESTIAVASEHFEMDVKKTSAPKPRARPQRTRPRHADELCSFL